MKKKSNLLGRYQRIGILVIRHLPSLFHTQFDLTSCFENVQDQVPWHILTNLSFWAKHKHIVSDWNGSGYDADTQVFLWEKSYCKCLCEPII